MVSKPGFDRLGSRKTCGKRFRAKTGKCQTVLGVSRDVLNRALWWFMVTLLVTCALADQNNGSLLMGPKYAVDRDGHCWGILGRWLCLSWGTARVPALDEVLEQETLKPEPACDTVHLLRGFPRYPAKTVFGSHERTQENPHGRLNSAKEYYKLQSAPQYNHKYKHTIMRTINHKINVLKYNNPRTRPYSI